MPKALFSFIVEQNDLRRSIFHYYYGNDGEHEEFFLSNIIERNVFRSDYQVFDMDLPSRQCLVKSPFSKALISHNLIQYIPTLRTYDSRQDQMIQARERTDNLLICLSADLSVIGQLIGLADMKNGYIGRISVRPIFGPISVAF